MTTNQTLDQLSARLMASIGEVLDQTSPSRVIVQGDTTTAMVGAIASYYRKIPVSHVEAGLRSGSIYAPWPEEVNRKVISAIADQNFTPTENAPKARKKENVPPHPIDATGQTAVE